MNIMLSAYSMSDKPKGVHCFKFVGQYASEQKDAVKILKTRHDGTSILKVGYRPKRAHCFKFMGIYESEQKDAVKILTQDTPRRHV